ncbi:hypothetical protein ACFQV2_38840 [Actinokineospora soli]|uniref:Uncharacterized protein n=1 Tax=Actinokineospora soli TaxID=1048753 RepID=A0ABW2U0F4_9PSEU
MELPQGPVEEVRHDLPVPPDQPVRVPRSSASASVNDPCVAFGAVNALCGPSDRAINARHDGFGGPAPTSRNGLSSPHCATWSRSLPSSSSA